MHNVPDGDLLRYFKRFVRGFGGFIFARSMTYSDGADETVPELKLIIEDPENGDYVKLRGGSDEEEEESPAGCWIGSVTSVWFWVKLISLVAFLGLLAFVIIKWIAPFLIEKVCFFQESLMLFFF